MHIKEDRIPLGFISPNNTAFLIWNGILALLVLYTGFSVPVSIAFLENESTALNYTSLVIDMLFISDILITFRTGLEVKQSGKLQVKYCRRSIAKEYFKTYFLIDVLANFPFDLVLVAIEATSTRLLRLLKVMKIIKLARITKIIRLTNLNSLTKRLENVSSSVFSPSSSRLLNTLGWALFTTHLGTCLWYSTTTIFVYSKAEVNWLALYTQEGVTEILFLGEKYFVSLYWCISTLTSVGFGDIAPSNDLERFIAIIICWVGATIFGFMLGYLSQIISNANRAKNEYREQMDSIGAYLRYRRVPKSLRLRIIKYFLYYYSKSSLFDEKEILNNLSNYLRVELSMFLTSDILANIDIFKDISDPSFFSMIVTMLRPLSAAAGDIIYFTEEIASEIYIILKGEIEMISNKGYVISRLSEGDHFGELDIRKKLVRRKYTTRATREADLFSLSKEDLKSVCEVFPQVYSQIVQSITKRIKIEKNLKVNSKVQKMLSNQEGVDNNVSYNPVRKSLKAASKAVSWILRDPEEHEKETKIRKRSQLRRTNSISMASQENTIPGYNETLNQDQMMQQHTQYLGDMMTYLEKDINESLS